MPLHTSVRVIFPKSKFDCHSPVQTFSWPLIALRAKSELSIIFYGAYLTSDLDWALWLLTYFPNSVHWPYLYQPLLGFLNPRCFFPHRAFVPVRPLCLEQPLSALGLVNSDLSFQSQLKYSSLQKAMVHHMPVLLHHCVVYYSFLFLTKLSALSWQGPCQSC